MPNAKHDYSLNLVHDHTAHALVISTVGVNKDVLEVGCASGYLSKIFRDNGCKVTGVEIEPYRAEAASEFCDRIVIGSIEDEGTIAAIKGLYDVIVFADVLEHLRFPDEVLIKLKPFLKEKGFIVLSLPNVANWKIRLNLLRGKFCYTDEGILDKTHLRLFTLDTAMKMLKECGYGMEEFMPGATRMPRILVRLWPTFFAVHLIFKARKV